MLRIFSLASLSLLVGCISIGRADEPDRLTVGLQKDGRIVVPTNQILSPAGEQILFPGRPVDLAWADGGATLVVKNISDLVFIDVATNRIVQTLASPVGFSVVGLDAGDGIVRVTDAKDHLRIAVRGADGKYAWEDPVEVPKPKAGSAHPAGVAWASAETVWVTSTRGNNVQLVNWKTGKPADGARRRRPLRRPARRGGQVSTSPTGAATCRRRAIRPHRLPRLRSTWTNAASPTGGPFRS